MTDSVCTFSFRARVEALAPRAELAPLEHRVSKDVLDRRGLRALGERL